MKNYKGYRGCTNKRLTLFNEIYIYIYTCIGV